MRDIFLIIISIRHAITTLVKDIDTGGRKLPRADSTLE